MDRAGLTYTCTEERTTCRFNVSSKPLARWINEHFGRGCAGKRIPSWLLGCGEELRSAFFEGYLFADGSIKTQTKGGGRVRKIATINRDLAIGTRMLATSLGISASITVNKARENVKIEGRSVVTQDCYEIYMYDSYRSAFFDNGFLWGKVRSVEPTGAIKDVYNFEVEEDNSYVADGIVVHNCQGFSTAGLRKSLDDARSNLCLAFVMLADAMDERRAAEGEEQTYVIWENVPGALSVNDNAFGCFIAGLVGADSPLVPPDGRKWTDAGYAVGPKRALSWRIRDAQYEGVAQRRNRIFLVAGPVSYANAIANLNFERDVKRRDVRPIREPSPTRFSASVAPTLGTDHDLDGGLVGDLEGVA